MIFSNRCVLPSYINTRLMGESQPAPGRGSVVELMIGEVKAVVEPTDKRSKSGRYREYSVDVIYQKDSGIASTVRFEHCLLMNPFGGVADKCVYSLRADANIPEKHKTTTTGSKVLLLCVSGMSNRAFIIGGVRSDEVKDDSGHTYFWKFNGLSQAVADDGSWTLQFNGKTDTNDVVADDLHIHAPTTINIAANGNFDVSTKDRAQYFTIDHAQRQVFVHADTKATVSCNGDIVITSTGVKVGDATDKWPLFSTYRKAETKMFKDVSQQLKDLAQSLQLASVELAKPVVGGPLAAPHILRASVIAQTAAAAIDNFERRADSYLSPKNLND